MHFEEDYIVPEHGEYSEEKQASTYHCTDHDRQMSSEYEDDTERQYDLLCAFQVREKSVSIDGKRKGAGLNEDNLDEDSE